MRGTFSRDPGFGAGTPPRARGSGYAPASPRVLAPSRASRACAAAFVRARASGSDPLVRSRRVFGAPDTVVRGRASASAGVMAGNAGTYRAALVAAAASGDLDHLLALVASRAPDDVTPATRLTFMGVALLRGASAGHADVVRALLRAGDLDVSKPNGAGNTALHCAAEGGHARCVAVLLEAGAKLTSRNNEGKTPIAVSRNHAIRAAISAEVRRRKDAETRTSAATSLSASPARTPNRARSSATMTPTGASSSPRSSSSSRGAASFAAPPPSAAASLAPPATRARHSKPHAAAELVRRRRGVPPRAGVARGGVHPAKAPRRPALRRVPPRLLQRGRGDVARDASVRAQLLRRVRPRHARPRRPREGVQVPARPHDVQQEPRAQGEHDHARPHRVHGDARSRGWGGTLGACIGERRRGRAAGRAEYKNRRKTDEVRRAEGARGRGGEPADPGGGLAGGRTDARGTRGPVGPARRVADPAAQAFAMTGGDEARENTTLR